MSGTKIHAETVNSFREATNFHNANTAVVNVRIDTDTDNVTGRPTTTLSVKPFIEAPQF